MTLAMNPSTEGIKVAGFIFFLNGEINIGGWHYESQIHKN